MSSFFKQLSLIFGMIVVVIGFLIAVFWYFTTPHAGEAFQEQGRNHIREDEHFTAYNSNPPTSGPHYGLAAEWGIYDEELPDERVLHNLEHGGIWISYKDLKSEELDSLKKVADQYPYRVVLTPRSKNDRRIAVASWTRLYASDQVEKDKILYFIRKNTNKSPERLAQ